MRKTNSWVRWAWLAGAAVGLALPGTALARTIIVRSGESIQAAVDAARPGDTIKVKNGVYTGTSGGDSVVSVVRAFRPPPAAYPCG